MQFSKYAITTGITVDSINQSKRDKIGDISGLGRELSDGEYFFSLLNILL